MTDTTESWSQVRVGGSGHPFIHRCQIPAVIAIWFGILSEKEISCSQSLSDFKGNMEEERREIKA